MSLETITAISKIQRQTLLRLLSEVGCAQPSSAELLRGDGSDRGFLRLGGPGWSLMAILPSPTLNKAQAEARAVWEIGRHLARRQVPVPELVGYDADTGIVLCEDLGDCRLHDMVSNDACASGAVVELYRQAVAVLLTMQLTGAEGFEVGWCWDTPRYDRELMLARESGYFWEACCRDLLGLGGLPSALAADFRQLAELAASQPAGFFLHRDYQSRNLLVKDGRIRIIDFQGGRLGPLGYDLAALLNDPYAALPLPLREQLFAHYRELLNAQRPELVADFTAGYHWLALQRNLQILGAFAFLSTVRGKPFFRAYLAPAAVNLKTLLAGSGSRRLPALAALAAELPDRLKHLDIT